LYLLIKISQQIPVDDDFIYEEFDIPKPANYEALKQQQTEAALNTIETLKKQNLNNPTNRANTIKERLLNFF
jgi:hypothetical protein